MNAFKNTGGRLFRIALAFTILCGIALILMSIFTYRAMADMKELASMTDDAGESIQVPVTFYIQLIDNMKFGTVLASLSGVLIAIAARYGLRETSKNIGNGISSRASNGNKSTTSEDGDRN